MRYDDETLRKMQLMELGILKEVDRVCREHDIAYFLDSGSALGAARHDGFIPWDDDIDVGMMRADYERFLSVAPEALGEQYVLSEPMTNAIHSAMFAKVWLRGTKFYTVETLDAGLGRVRKMGAEALNNMLQAK
jgi:lipopolysaccharide cholinephosphotransferase